MIAFQRVALDRRVLNQVLHHSITWKTPKSSYMFAISWALTKGDWWKDSADDVAKFFSCSWKKESDVYVRTAVYIGQLAIVWQTRPKAPESNESA